MENLNDKHYHQNASKVFLSKDSLASNHRMSFSGMVLGHSNLHIIQGYTQSHLFLQKLKIVSHESNYAFPEYYETQKK
jgi:hypothetical protein